jgi:FAD/FMN-containing dehydrogenase
VRTTWPTVGESVACNTAGPDRQPAVAHVEALTLVTPEGELRRLSRNRDRELFSLAVGGYGLFGAFYSITLRIDSLAKAVAQACSPERILLRPGRATPRALELLVPPEVLETFIAEADARCYEWRIALRTVELRRTAAEEDTFLRWASRDFGALKLSFSACETLGERVRAMQLRRELIDAAIAVGGRFQIASTPEATCEQIDACYPQLAAFLAHKRRFDRHERLTNDWYVHMRGRLGGERCKVSWGD